MAEAQQKRLREETHHAEALNLDDSNSNAKRQKPYNNILSFLDEEEEQEEPNQDLSAIFTTLEQELSSSSTNFDFDSLPFTAEDKQTTTTAAEADESVESVMRHLLEASDDELGIPNPVEINSAENFPFGCVDDGLWEFEDVAANYYTVLQSEFLM